MDLGKGSAQYRALQKYLTDRYADTVVLTLAEIEDILGFNLPGPARLQQDWWANLASEQSESWISAERNATPNLTAKTVTFTRVTA